jgi:hypothetical protein
MRLATRRIGRERPAEFRLACRSLCNLGRCRDSVFAMRPHKKTDVVEHPQVFDHVGLLVNGLPGPAGLPFV